MSAGVETNLRYPFWAAAAVAVGGEWEERFIEAAGLYAYTVTTKQAGRQGKAEASQAGSLAKAARD